MRKALAFIFCALALPLAAQAQEKQKSLIIRYWPEEGRIQFKQDKKARVRVFIHTGKEKASYTADLLGEVAIEDKDWVRLSTEELDKLVESMFMFPGSNAPSQIRICNLFSNPSPGKPGSAVPKCRDWKKP